MSEIVYAHLQPSINLGLEESKFWEMTIAEIMRYEEGATWRLKQKAQFDYTLAYLNGISSARVVSKNVEFPNIEDVYTELFDKPKKEKEEEAINAVEIKSVNNFLAFAQKHNAKKRKGESNDK